jgi:hypothetical protein
MLGNYQLLYMILDYLESKKFILCRDSRNLIEWPDLLRDFRLAGTSG